MVAQNLAVPPEIDHYLSVGNRLAQAGRFAEAEACARKVIALRPSHAMAHNNFGFARQMQGDREMAIVAYNRALNLDPRLSVTRRNLALLLARLGRREDSFPLFHAETRTPDGMRWLQNLVSTTIQASDLKFAAELAAISAALRWGTDWYPPSRDKSLTPFPLHTPERRLNIAKLEHDILQFQYLQRQKVLGEELTPIISAYRRVIERLKPKGEHTWTPLAGENLHAIGGVYNRIVYVRHTPRVRRALSDAWNAEKVERIFLESRPGVAVVDNFLSDTALNELRAFCLESTVWSGNRYAHGRLGAFFHDGFNCPLLIQIGEELRSALPRIIHDRHALRQIWGFKNAPNQPGDFTTHADFAAVNVNIWITPDEANLDPSTGGLVVYNIDAPLNWEFSTYNGRSDVIKAFLRRENARSATIPYRQNRAVIFNSDLFHCTDTIKFRPEYENRRINVTMLYGVREDDNRRLSRSEPLMDQRASAWRSAAFAAARSVR